MREKPDLDDYKFLHYIFLEFYPNHTIIRVVFFGYIKYMILAKKMSSEIVANLEKHTGLQGITCLSYQQILDEPSKSFWIDTIDGEKKHIA